VLLEWKEFEEAIKLDASDKRWYAFLNLFVIWFAWVNLAPFKGGIILSLSTPAMHDIEPI
jgi:hypothetical protein